MLALHLLLRRGMPSLVPLLVQPVPVLLPLVERGHFPVRAAHVQHQRPQLLAVIRSLPELFDELVALLVGRRQLLFQLGTLSLDSVDFVRERLVRRLGLASARSPSRSS